MLDEGFTPCHDVKKAFNGAQFAIRFRNHQIRVATSWSVEADLPGSSAALDLLFEAIKVIEPLQKSFWRLLYKQFVYCWVLRSTVLIERIWWWFIETLSADEILYEKWKERGFFSITNLFEEEQAHTYHE